MANTNKLCIMQLPLVSKPCAMWPTTHVTFTCAGGFMSKSETKRSIENATGKWTGVTPPVNYLSPVSKDFRRRDDVVGRLGRQVGKVHMRKTIDKPQPRRRIRLPTLVNTVLMILSQNGNDGSKLCYDSDGIQRSLNEFRFPKMKNMKMFLNESRLLPWQSY